MSIYKAQQPGLASFANPRKEEPSLFDLIFEFAARSKQLSIEDTETGRRRCTVVFGNDTSDEDRSRLVAGLEAKGYSVEHSVQFPPRVRFAPPPRADRNAKKPAEFGPRNRWGELR